MDHTVCSVSPNHSILLPSDCHLNSLSNTQENNSPQITTNTEQPEEIIQNCQKLVDISLIDENPLIREIISFHQNLYSPTKVLTLYQQILKITAKKFGEENPILAKIYEILAVAHKDLDHNEKAIKYYEKFLKI